jgi:hypothetical protein
MLFDIRSGWILFGSGHVRLIFLKYQIGSNSGPDESDKFLKSGRIMPLLDIYYGLTTHYRLVVVCVSVLG